MTSNYQHCQHPASWRGVPSSTRIPTTPSNPARARGVTLIELLIVLAIVGTVGATTFVAGRQILSGQQRATALNTVRQSVRSGATTAAARGVPLELFRDGSALILRRLSDSAELRRFDLPAGTTIGFPSGQVLRFTPPGKIESASLAALPDPLLLQAGDRTIRLQISTIGEVQEVVP